MGTMIHPGPMLAIRADAANRSGTGHVMRTLAIAQAWLRRGGRVQYLTREMTAALVERVESQGCEVEWIEGDDAEATAGLADRGRAKVLLVDHYELNVSWWNALPAERRWSTAAINDFTNPIHRQADVLVSPRATSLPGESPSGPDFLLIREDLLRKGALDPPSPEARRLLLVLGGADPLDAVPRVARQLLEAVPTIQVRAVVGPAAKNLEAVEALAGESAALEVVHRPEDMRRHYEWADTAVVAPSTTAFEALHHGLVTGLVLSAGNQEEVARDLVALGCSLILADARDSAAALDPEGLRLLISDGETRRALAAAGAALVDGLGAARICDLLGLPDLSFRCVREPDSEVVLDWANDPQTRAASFSSDPISTEAHEIWFQKRIRTHEPFWFAVDSTGKPYAVLRFDLNGEGNAVASINLAPEERGKGLASLILSRACQKFLGIYPQIGIDAWIRSENVASQRCFQKAGFALAGTFPDRLLYRYSP